MTFEQTFLDEQGAITDADGHVSFPGFDIAADPCPEAFITIVAGFTLLRVSGADAAEFLHAQLTSEVTDLPDGGGGTAAWCNPKGRVITTFLIFRFDEEFYLLLPAVLQERVVKRLQMFVLRSDVRITDFTEGRSIIGVRGRSDNANTFKITKLNERLHLFMPDTGAGRCLIVDETARLQTLWPELAGTIQPVDSRCWNRLDIDAGIAWLNEDTTGQFLPQELNLEDSGGLSFTKGCYPGQEVVARVHYRGQVKRRMFHASADGKAGVTAGMKIRNGDNKTAGTVVAAAPAGRDNAILAVIDTSVSDTGNLSLENGFALKLERK